jgi:outer membrane protein TolC
VGFEEGVVPASALLEAQTVWLNAKSNKIDAEVETKLSEVRLRQAMGVLSVK